MTKKINDAPVVSMALYSAKELDARIVRLHTAGQNIQKEMHRIACSVLACFGENNDVRKATNFVLKLEAAMPEMSRVNALKAWFEAHAPIKFATPEEIKNGATAAYFVKDGKYKLGDAMAKPFWKFVASEGKAYEPLDIEKFTQQMIAKLVKDAKETGADHGALLMALKGVTPATHEIKPETKVDAITGATIQ